MRTGNRKLHLIRRYVKRFFSTSRGKLGSTRLIGNGLDHRRGLPRTVVLLATDTVIADRTADGAVAIE
jgi:hypothetical protein